MPFIYCNASVLNLGTPAADLESSWLSSMLEARGAARGAAEGLHPQGLQVLQLGVRPNWRRGKMLRRPPTRIELKPEDKEEYEEIRARPRAAAAAAAAAAGRARPRKTRGRADQGGSCGEGERGAANRTAEVRGEQPLNCKIRFF